MARERILVVDDEQDIRELVSYNLMKNGYQVTTVATGEDAVTKARSELPDLIVLDLMLPGIDGLEVAKHLKHNSKTQRIPIIMLTAKGEEVDIVTGLEIGADDYITKPFSPRVLIARVRAMLRQKQRTATGDSDVIRRGLLMIDPGRHLVTIDSTPLELTFTEFKILQLLTRRPGWVLSRNQIIERVHGDDYPVTERSVDVQIVGLRKKLGTLGDKIETVRGVGYRFNE